MHATLVAEKIDDPKLDPNGSPNYIANSAKTPSVVLGRLLC